MKDNKNYVVKWLTIIITYIFINYTHKKGIRRK